MENRNGDERIITYLKEGKWITIFYEHSEFVDAILNYFDFADDKEINYLTECIRDRFENITNFEDENNSKIKNTNTTSEYIFKHSTNSENMNNNYRKCVMVNTNITSSKKARDSIINMEKDNKNIDVYLSCLTSDEKNEVIALCNIIILCNLKDDVILKEEIQKIIQQYSANMITLICACLIREMEDPYFTNKIEISINTVINLYKFISLNFGGLCPCHCII